jgi:hypothetical protein
VVVPIIGWGSPDVIGDWAGLAKIPEVSIPVLTLDGISQVLQESIALIPESILTPKINSFF